MSPEDSRNATLLRLTAADDREAFREFVLVNERAVGGIIAQVLDDPRDVDEAIADTFVQVWRSAASFRGDAKVSTWLYRIAMNQALKRTRRVRREGVPLKSVEHLPVAEGDDPASTGALRSEQIQAVRAALARLPADLRVVVVLRDIEGWSTSESATVLELTESGLKTKLHRGRMRLRSMLASEWSSKDMER